MVPGPELEKHHIFLMEVVRHCRLPLRGGKTARGHDHLADAASPAALFDRTDSPLIIAYLSTGFKRERPSGLQEPK